MCENCGRPSGCDCREKARARSNAYARKLREAAFEVYGGPICACCGEQERCFLTIDHINGGGNEHRRSIGGISNNFYQWLKATGYPPGFQVLCQNCNVGKHRNGGTCPHKEVMPA